MLSQASLGWFQIADAEEKKSLQKWSTEVLKKD